MLQARLELVGHREAVQHHLQPLGVVLEHGQRLVVGGAGVDDQRLAGAACQPDLGQEGPALILRRCALSVVVKPRLADRHAARMGGQRLELGQVGVVEAGGRVGMPADGGVDLREVLGRSQGCPAAGAVEADGEDPLHARLGGRGDELGVRRLAQLQMRVAVDHVRLGNSGSSATTDGAVAPCGKAAWS